MRALCLLFFTIGGLVAQVEEGFRLYNTNCATCHGSDGDLIPGAEIRGGQFRRVSSDNELARLLINGIPGTPMPATNFNAQQISAMIAYLRSPRSAPARSTSPGDAARGMAVFQGVGACLNCHRVSGQGSRLGPDLSSIGAVRPTAELERSILDPDAAVLPQNRFIRATTREGATITGRRLNEDTLTVQLIDSNERLVSLTKAELREYNLVKTSPMPSYRGKLSPQDLADVVSYLLSLKGSDTP